MESIEDLKKRRDLLAEIVALSARLPDEEDIAAAADHLDVLKEIEARDMPDEDEIDAASNHLATLRKLEDYLPPDESEIKAANEYLATLKAIEEGVEV